VSFWNNISNGISDLTKFVVSGIARLMALSFILLIALGILYALYWVGKAILGFIKYYSQFA
jgi:hypothetical protein